MTLSQELKELYASGGSSIILHTLEFSHSLFGGSIYLVRDFQNFTAVLENGQEVEYAACAFTVNPPSTDIKGRETLAISMDSTGREVIQKLELAIENPREPIKVVYRIYLDTDPSEPQNNPPTILNLSKVAIDNMRVTGMAESPEIVNSSFPNVLYSPTVFKALQYVQ